MAFSNTPLSSMNSSVTPLEMSSPAIVSIAVQCLGFSCGVRKYSMQGILDLKLAT